MNERVNRGFLLLLLVVVFASASTSLSARTQIVSIVIDGSAVQQTAAVIDGVPFVPLSVLNNLVGKTVSYDSGSQRIVVESKGHSDSSLHIKPVLEIVMGNPEFREMVESLGCPYRSSVVVPTKLEYYSCVILNNENAVSGKLVERLKRFAKAGGGVVMVGAIPLKLVDVQNLPSPAPWESSCLTLKSISDWFGCPGILKVDYNSATSGHWLGTPASVIAKTDRPLGTSIEKGTTLLRYQGGAAAYPMLDGADEFTEIVAEWQSEPTEEQHYDVKVRYIAAMAHPYGSGCIYWQSVVDEPNYPKLKELLRAGIWRAATGRNLVLK